MRKALQSAMMCRIGGRLQNLRGFEGRLVKHRRCSASPARGAGQCGPRGCGHTRRSSSGEAAPKGPWACFGSSKLTHLRTQGWLGNASRIKQTASTQAGYGATGRALGNVGAAAAFHGDPASYHDAGAAAGARVHGCGAAQGGQRAPITRSGAAFSPCLALPSDRLVAKPWRRSSTATR